MSITPAFVGPSRSQSNTFTAGSGQCRNIWNPGPNGSRIHRISIARNTHFPGGVTFWELVPLTLKTNMGTAALANSPGTITRSAGSFLTDDWKPGDFLMVRGATTPANDLPFVLVNTVAADTLTVFESTPFTAESLPSGSKLYRGIYLGRLQWPMAPADANPTFGPGFGKISELLEPDQFLSLSASSLLAASLGFDMGTGGATLQVRVEGADY